MFAMVVLEDAFDNRHKYTPPINLDEILRQKGNQNDK